jgi:hypothetical protein
VGGEGEGRSKKEGDTRRNGGKVGGTFAIFRSVSKSSLACIRRDGTEEDEKVERGRREGWREKVVVEDGQQQLNIENDSGNRGTPLFANNERAWFGLIIYEGNAIAQIGWTWIVSLERVSDALEGEGEGEGGEGGILKEMEREMKRSPGDRI